MSELHFCTIEDVKGLLTTASRFAETVEKTRASVTANLNRWLRRTLDFEEGIVEYHRALDLPYAGRENIWLEKKVIEGAPIIRYSRRREWDQDETLLTLNEHYVVDASVGKITVFGPMRAFADGIRIEYSGGYKARVVNGTETDAMDCPANLSMAAALQCAFEAKRGIGGDQGKSNDDNGKGQVPIKLVDGFIPEVIDAFKSYRRLLVGLA